MNLYQFSNATQQVLVQVHRCPLNTLRDLQADFMELVLAQLINY